MLSQRVTGNGVSQNATGTNGVLFLGNDGTVGRTQHATYDRALAAVPAHADGGPLRVVVLFDDEVVDHLPAEPHDCHVDGALTPSGVVPLG